MCVTYQYVTDMKVTLQNKILIPIVLTIVLLIGGSAFLLSHFITERFENNTISMLAAGNDILSKNIHSSVKAYRNILRSISAMPTLRMLVHDTNYHETDANQLLVNLADIFPDFLQFNLTDMDGNVIASSNIHSVGKVHVADRTYFTCAILGEETISEPLVSKSTGQKSIVVASPVRDYADAIRGVVYAVISCEQIIAETIKNVKMAETGYAYIVDGNSGLMLAHNVWAKIQSMNMFDYQPWMNGLKGGETGIKKDYRDSSGKPRVAVYSKDSLSGWIAVSCIASSEIESQEAFIRNLIFLLTLGSAVLIGIIVCCIIRPVTRDILKISHFASAVTSGHMDSTLDITRNDELGVLKNALSTMVAALKNFVDREIRTTEEHRAHLAAMRDSMILTLADLVESRDATTGQHIKKTAAYVKIIMQQLQKENVFPGQITDSFIDNVVRSAPLHDIGKIVVSDVILNKPGKLTDDEFVTMKKHAAAGGEIIRHIIDITPDSQYLAEAEHLAESHHERWDGKGYPEGLAGDAIPLSARIMAVADVFDALVSDRPYKRGFSLEKAFAIIREESGTHFDPRVVTAFFAAMEKIIAAESFFKQKEQLGDCQALC